MAVTSTCSVYLAGPIDGLEDYGRGWREQVARELPKGVVVFSPAHAYVGAEMRTAPALHRLNAAMLAECDVVIANLTYGVTLGTAREIEHARSLDKPTGAILTEETLQGEPSLMLYDLLTGSTFTEVLTQCIALIEE